MSKRDLKKYLETLTKSQMEEQILDLYSRFKDVKVYYDFAFNPKEDQLLENAKLKISKEYNLNVRKPKARRSVAQKLIKHFKTLEVQPEIIVDLMLYNIEIAQVFSSERRIRQDAFYVSMLNSFRDTLGFVKLHGLESQFQKRLEQIVDETDLQNWINSPAFETEIQNTFRA
ncbi:hypothetical protein KFE94_13420 [bacterium SCSIO 12643]|nr:hypothetical protein KFE94_13420 [bacterium SCSIO 12643]